MWKGRDKWGALFSHLHRNANFMATSIHAERRAHCVTPSTCKTLRTLPSQHPCENSQPCARLCTLLSPPSMTSTTRTLPAIHTHWSVLCREAQIYEHSSAHAQLSVCTAMLQAKPPIPSSLPQRHFRPLCTRSPQRLSVLPPKYPLRNALATRSYSIVCVAIC